jgi:hypothetical protein
MSAQAQHDLQVKVHPDRSNPAELARSAVSALFYAARWARRPGQFARGITRTYVRHACALLREANKAAKRQAVQP